MVQAAPPSSSAKAVPNPGGPDHLIAGDLLAKMTDRDLLEHTWLAVDRLEKRLDRMLAHPLIKRFFNG